MTRGGATPSDHMGDREALLLSVLGRGPNRPSMDDASSDQSRRRLRLDAVVAPFRSLWHVVTSPLETKRRLSKHYDACL